MIPSLLMQFGISYLRLGKVHVSSLKSRCRVLFWFEKIACGIFALFMGCSTLLHVNQCRNHVNQCRNHVGTVQEKWKSFLTRRTHGFMHTDFQDFITKESFASR